MALAVWLAAGSALAQDAHYWDNQYGTTAELLGGLVVGSATDLSATFYNPGWVALNNQPSLLLTTKAVEAYQVKISNGLGRGIDPVSNTITPSPGYIAGRFSLGKDYGWKWAYTYLQRVQFRFDASGLRIDSNEAPPATGNLWFSGEAFRDARLDESWYGVTFARRVADNVAIGFSPYVAQRSQRSRTQVSAQALDAASTSSTGFLVDDYTYWNVRLLMKMGVAVEWEKWTAGLAITTPSLSIMGSGSVYQNVSLAGDYLPESPGIDPPYLQANYQESLGATWISPLSIAAGGAFRVGPTRIHVTFEWFDAVSRYEVLSPEPYEIQSVPGEFDRYNLDYAAKNVLNFGLGLDRSFSEDFSVYASYRRDNTATPTELGGELSIGVWDLNHVSGGASFQLLSLEFTAGLQYSWGNDLTNNFVDFRNDETGEINGQLTNQPISFKRLKALLGFNLPFAVPVD